MPSVFGSARSCGPTRIRVPATLPFACGSTSALGTHQSSAKITDRYSARDLIGRQVVAVTGFDPIRVGGFRSDVLILDALDASGVVLLAPDAAVPAGTEIA